MLQRWVGHQNRITYNHQNRDQLLSKLTEWEILARWSVFYYDSTFQIEQMLNTVENISISRKCQCFDCLKLNNNISLMRFLKKIWLNSVQSHWLISKSLLHENHSMKDSIFQESKRTHLFIIKLHQKTKSHLICLQCIC